MQIILLLIGMSIGSFINGLAVRATSDRKLFSSRSLCFKCHKKIAWYDLIPVISWFFLGGRCRYCKQKIPFRYPVTELFVGLLTFFFFYDSQITWVLLAHYFFVLSFFLNVLTDAIDYRVYDSFLYIMIGFAALYVFLDGVLLSAFLSGILLVVIMGAIASFVSILTKKQAMGSGDYFVFFVLGLVVHSNKILDLLLFSSVLGIIFALLFKKNKLPFFPLLFFGYVFILLGGSLS